MNEKSLVLAYLLWVLGGFVGLHHFYLRRDTQTMLYLCLPGGYFGLGWLRDLWRLPEYVRDANEEKQYIHKLTQAMRTNKRPPFSMTRLMAELLVGNAFGVMLVLGIPNADDLGVDIEQFAHLISPIGIATGVWLVGNIGREKGSILPSLLTLYPVSLLQYFGFFPRGLFILSLSGVLAFQFFARKWRRTPRKFGSLPKRIAVITLCCGLYWSLWGSFLYFNLTMTTKEGDEIKFRDAVANFMKSPVVQEFRANVAALLEYAKQQGFWAAFEKLKDSLDPLGEKNALKVLGVDKDAEPELIRSRYRELSRKYHPDKQRNDEDRVEAQAKFIEVQEAYERLTAIRNRRQASKSTQI